MPQSQFPKFLDGDVVIVLTDEAETEFVLHSKVLAKPSQFFANGNKSEWLTNKMTGTKTIKGVEVEMKLYKLVKDGEGIYLLEGKTHRTPKNAKPFLEHSRSPAHVAHFLAFAFMYTNSKIPIEQTPENMSASWGDIYQHLHTFMNTYGC
ncbi:hypothetical protein EJ08DRAFT_698211 [Tothia fuscella]|uniref:BTB domain-containing protein n=1 Tax=Tothia fuscella TaxID=1048955 RepID=A0A9P4NP57_9PEZI|nr:hypothetical protein EJ08DRAFT_698211 [Tothia fuscella]